MFSRHLIWNHRARLTALLTLTVSITLAIVFAVVILVVRTQALNRRYAELEQAVRTIAFEWSGPSSLDDDLPGVDSAVFDSSGHLLATDSKARLSYLTGFLRTRDIAEYGLKSGSTVFVGRISLKETEAGFSQLTWILAALWLPLTLLTAAASWYGGGLVLRPIRELVSSAERLSDLSEDHLLKTTDRAEYATLVESLNQLIARVRRAASLQEQFAADAAHELRNPLAILRMRIETNLRRERTAEEHVESQKAMLSQIERLTSIVETLLSSARLADDTAAHIRLDSATKNAACDWAGMRQFDPDRLDIYAIPCEVSIQEEELRIIVSNLLDNSARHSPPGSRIEVSLHVLAGQAVLEVRDSGKGLTQEQASRAFDRFYRSDEARDRGSGGVGIGLSVVKRIVESRLGSVEFVPVERGALVRVTLPLAIVRENAIPARC